MAPRRVLVRGSLNIDGAYLTKRAAPLSIDQKSSLSTSARLQRFVSRSDARGIVKPGQTIAATSLTRSAGGKGANVAAACARGGAEADIVGAAGQDGSIVVDALRDAGVGTSHLRIDESTPTGRAIIQVDSAGENCIVIVAGCNGLAVDLPPLDDYALLICQNEVPLDETAKALRAARTAGLVTLFNPSPMPSSEQLKSFPLDAVDWLVVNEDEAKSLAKTLGVDELSAATALSGCTGFVVTLGSRGVRATLRGADGELGTIEAASPSVAQVVDTTGAGDAFTVRHAIASELIVADECECTLVCYKKLESAC